MWDLPVVGDRVLVTGGRFAGKEGVIREWGLLGFRVMLEDGRVRTIFRWNVRKERSIWTY